MFFAFLLAALTPTDVTVAALSPGQVGSRGADVSFVEHEAEHARTTGQVIGPDRSFGTLPS